MGRLDNKEEFENLLILLPTFGYNMLLLKKTTNYEPRSGDFIMGCVEEIIRRGGDIIVSLPKSIAGQRESEFAR
jgi:hypothetical protein